MSKKHYILIILIVVFLLIPGKSKAEAPIVVIPPRDMTIKGIIEYQAKAYNVSLPLMHKIIKCESGYNEKAWNKSDPGVGSKGIFQFQTGTFYSYAKKLNIESPDIWNTDQQIQVAAYMFSIGQMRQWSCAHKLNLVK